MTDTGMLHITLNCSSEKKPHVQITSSRPLHVCQLFTGKTPQQTLTLLPLLFNVCGTAQAFAAITAVTQALAIAPAPDITIARQLLLQTEIIREHCWWLLFDTDKSKLAPFIQLPQAFKLALFSGGDAFQLTSQLQLNHLQLTQLNLTLLKHLDALFDRRRLELLAVHNLTELTTWLKNNHSLPALLITKLLTTNTASLGRITFPLLPDLDTQQLLDYINQQDADSLMRYPTWQGQPQENSCLNRQQQHPLVTASLRAFGNGLLTRLLSRLMELANIPTLLNEYNLALQTHASHQNVKLPASSAEGLAKIPTSRGLLIHHVNINAGMIDHYKIIAPTEWNFHPKGIAAFSLQQLLTTDTKLLAEQASLIIKALDPCVKFNLVIQ